MQTMRLSPTHNNSPRRVREVQIRLYTHIKEEWGRVGGGGGGGGGAVNIGQSSILIH